MSISPPSRIPQSCGRQASAVAAIASARTGDGALSIPLMSPVSARKHCVGTGIPKPISFQVSTTYHASPKHSPKAEMEGPVLSAIQMPNCTRGAVYERLTLVQKIATKRKSYVAERRRLADAQRQVLHIQSTIDLLQAKLRKLCAEGTTETNANGHFGINGDHAAALEPLPHTQLAAGTGVGAATVSPSGSFCAGCRDRDNQIEVLLDERDTILQELTAITTSGIGNCGTLNGIGTNGTSGKDCQSTTCSYDELAAVRQAAEEANAQLEAVLAEHKAEREEMRQSLRRMHEEHASELELVRAQAEQKLEDQRQADEASRLSAERLLHIRGELIAQMQAQEDAVRKQLQLSRTTVAVREGELQGTLDLLRQQEGRIGAQALCIRRLEKVRSDHSELEAVVEERMASLAEENTRLKQQFRQILECGKL